MDIRYTVTSVSEEEFTVTASVAGVEMQVKVPGLALEMVSADGGMGHTFRFRPDDILATKAAFAIGTGVTLTLSPDA